MNSPTRRLLACACVLAFPAHGWAQNPPGASNRPASRPPAATLENPITEAYLKAHLAKETPRLILTPQLERVIRQKLVSDPLIRNYHRHLQQEAASIVRQPVARHALQGFRMSAGSDMAKVLGILAMVYRLDRSPEILRRIEVELQAVTAFPDWNPQHFLDVSQMSLGVALALDWVGDALPRATVTAAKAALIEKGIRPSYNTAGERMGWITGNNNWNSVCHGGMVVAALAIADLDPALAAKTISRALDNLPNSLKEYAPDGAHPEGPSYWRFGTSFSVIAANVLTTALGKDFGIAQSPGFMESANFRLQMTAPSGDSFNFADSDTTMDGETSVLLAWFAAQTGDALYLDRPFFENLAAAETPADAASARQDQANFKPRAQEGAGRLSGPGLVWLAQFTPTKKSELPPEWLGRSRNAVAVFRRGKAEAGQLYLAVKGGAAQISHGNMDAGTFVFELNGVRWVVDPGNQDYYPLNKIGFPLSDYSQDSERWSLLTKSNLTHSTITVNGARYKVTASAPIVDFKRGERAEATIDLTEALNGQVKSLRRRFVVESEHSIVVEDRFETNALTKEIVWQLITVAEAIPVRNGVRLRQAGKELRVSILAPEDLSVTVISLDPPPLAIDKTIDGLKRIEIRIPANPLETGKGVIQVRLSGE